MVAMRRRLALLTSTCVLASLSYSVLHKGHQIKLAGLDSAASAAATPSQKFRNKPLVIHSTAIPVFQAESEAFKTVAQFTAQCPEIQIDGAITCHLLRLYPSGMIPVAKVSSATNAVRALTEEDTEMEVFGRSVLVPTRYGLRYTLTKSPDLTPGARGESHRDLCLATLAEQGAPLSTPVKVAGKTYAVQEILDDSVQTFDINERELAWTSIAYTLYMAPQTSWENRDGKHFSFDDLANTLLSAKLEDQSCGGVHILFALTYLIRADEQTAFLSDLVRSRIRERLTTFVATAVAAQQADGSWSLGWREPHKLQPAYVNSKPMKLLVTGHLLEWMEYLPIEMQPGRQVYQHGSAWLVATLPDLASQHPFPQTMFCPWTHALCALRNLTQNQPADRVLTRVVGPDVSHF